MDNNNEKKSSSGFGWIAIVVIIAIIIIGAVSCGSSEGSSSKRKWSDLSEKEKEDARWAYQAKQAEEEYKKNNYIDLLGHSF